MANPLQSLIHDTLTYLKDPLSPKGSFFASAEECALLRMKKEPVPRQAPPAPLRAPTQLTPPIRIAEKKPAPVPALPPQPESKRELPVSKSVPVEKPQEIPEIKQILAKIAPHLTLIDAIPDDTVAKQIAQGWKERLTDIEVVLLACSTDPETLELLKGLAKAIDQQLGKTKILLAGKMEQEKRWKPFLQKNRFRLILASYGMEQFPDLLSFYQPPLLEKTPLLKLDAAAVYKGLEHKAALWKTVCQILKK